jgi:NADH:ubiquinone oxidoreductase subunit 3 (subunit A)
MVNFVHSVAVHPDFLQGAPMLEPWIFIALLLGAGMLLPGVAIAANWLLSPKKPNAIKESIYECGIETVGETYVQLKGSYYIYALIFVVFDIEAVFLFPWAVAYDKLQLYMVLEGVLFIAILAAGLFYAWRKGVLEWV